MTVGIITTFRQSNFGSVLQAFALQHIINSLGYESKVIDYEYPNDFHRARSDKFIKRKPVSFLSRLKLIVKSLLECIGLRIIPKMKLLNKFIDKEMSCTKVYPTYGCIHNNPPKFDVYLSGSDQIWNPNTMFGDMTYFYDFAPDGSKIISYSSSFSCDTIPGEYIKQYRHYLSRYSAISVREKNGCTLVEKITGRKDAKLVLDPTLLLDKDEWMTYAKKTKRIKLPEKYILCYMLAYTYNPEEKMKDLLKFVQQKYKLPIISLSPIRQWDGGAFINIYSEQSIGNYEFLQLVNKAEIIVTSSFHGTAFAVNFGKPFFALQNGKSNSDDRISSLVSMVGLESQLVTTETRLIDKLIPYYDTFNALQRLNQCREDSISFLKYNLDN